MNNSGDTQGLAEAATVVIADDEPDLSQLTEMVTKQGYQVRQCSTDDEVRREIGKGGVDLVIAEMATSHIDGFELAQWVKKISPATHVLLLTGHVSDDGERLLGHRGIDGHLVKPVQLRRLQIMLRAFLVYENLDRATDAYVLAKRSPGRAELEQILGDVGIEVEFFDHPRALLARADHDPPHLLLVDIEAQQAEAGFELCEKIRGDRSIPYVPIVVLCDAPPRREWVVRAARLHVNGFLSRPLDPVVLKDRVLRLMRHTKNRSEQ